MGKEGEGKVEKNWKKNWKHLEEIEKIIEIIWKKLPSDYFVIFIF